MLGEICESQKELAAGGICPILRAISQLQAESSGVVVCVTSGHHMDAIAIRGVRLARVGPPKSQSLKKSCPKYL